MPSVISPESQVLQRHLALFENKSLLCAGDLKDDFPFQLNSKHVHVWSQYFDYAKDKSAVSFSLVSPPPAELILYYWTKNKQESRFHLMSLLSQSAVGQEVLIIGENRSGVRYVEKLLADYGDIGKIDSARRCGLYHFQLKNLPHFALAEYWQTYRHPSLNQLELHSLPAVFSRAELDVGTALLLSTLTPNLKGRVLDLGCGVGVIGAYMKQQSPQIDLVMSDIHFMALESAKRTLQANHLQGDVVASDVFSHIQGKFDLIISNPPFHDGVDTTYSIVQRLISQAKQYLKPKGELRIVANSFLPYEQWFTQYFGDYQLLAKTNKFKVYSVKNP